MTLHVVGMGRFWSFSTAVLKDFTPHHCPPTATVVGIPDRSSAGYPHIW